MVLGWLLGHQMGACGKGEQQLGKGKGWQETPGLAEQQQKCSKSCLLESGKVWWGWDNGKSAAISSSCCH